MFRRLLNHIHAWLDACARRPWLEARELVEMTDEEFEHRFGRGPL